jgi:iron complex outermembrane receptor protein
VVAADTLGAEDVDSIYIPIRYDNGGAFTADYKFDYQDFAASQAGFQTLGTRPENDPFLNPLGPTVDFIYSLQPGLGGTNTVAKEALDAIYDPNRGTDTLRVMGHGLTLQWKLNDNLTIKNIASYRTADAKNVGNSFEGNLLIDPFGGTGNLFTLLTALSTREQHQMSNELQILGDGDALTWVAGAFYFDEGGRDYNPVRSSLRTRTLPRTSRSGPATCSPTSTTRTSRLRSSRRRPGMPRTSSISPPVRGRRGTTARSSTTVPICRRPTGRRPPRSRTTSSPGKGVAEYSFNPDLMVYGKVGTGLPLGRRLQHRCLRPRGDHVLRGRPEGRVLRQPPARERGRVPLRLQGPAGLLLHDARLLRERGQGEN